MKRLLAPCALVCALSASAWGGVPINPNVGDDPPPPPDPPVTNSAPAPDEGSDSVVVITELGEVLISILF